MPASSLRNNSFKWGTITVVSTEDLRQILRRLYNEREKGIIDEQSYTFHSASMDMFCKGESGDYSICLSDASGKHANADEITMDQTSYDKINIQGVDPTFIHSVRVSPTPTGSSKRKSKPVKRIIEKCESEPSAVVEHNMGKPFTDAPQGECPPDPTQSVSVKDELYEGDSEGQQLVASRSSVEMDQAEMMRRFNEILATSQPGLQSISFQDAVQSLLAAASASCSSEPPLSTIMSSMSSFFPDTISPEGFMQAAVLAGGMVMGNHTTPVSNASINQSINMALLQGLSKMDSSVDVMRQAASTITKEERIDLDDLENFAQMFKKQRIKFGRFRCIISKMALNLSFKNMCKLRPLLKEWLADAEAAIASGASLNDLLDKGTPKQQPTVVDISEGSTRSEPHIKRRRKRTNLDMSQVVRVWFCNRRQKLRRSDEPETTDSVLMTSLKALQGVSTTLSTSIEPTCEPVETNGGA
uniref:POU domain protein n=1 Tax=Heterorhabditis bacteriophora TaxID=37862 RepID=A0A1I7XJE0_HETBA